jgi:hypothetical protein
MKHILPLNLWETKGIYQNDLSFNFPDYNKENFIKNTIPSLNENDLKENQIDTLYALYEANSLYNKKYDWFNKVSNDNRPILLESKTHTIIVFDGDFFAITNESFDILNSEKLYEDIFSDAWGSVSNFFSNAWDSVKSVGDKVGDWVKELSDGAKAVTGFVKLSYMATTAMRSNDWKVIANTIFNITQVLASTYSKNFNLSEPILAQVNSTCSGILNLWEGRTLFLEQWKTIPNAENIKEDELSKSLDKATPDSFLGVTKMLLGVRDLGKASNPSIKFENLTDLEKITEDSFSDEIKKSSEGLIKEGDGLGLAKSVLELSGNNTFGNDKSENMWKSYVLCQIAFGLENVYSEIKKDAIDSLSKANEYIPKAKEFPDMIQKWIETAEKTKMEGGMGIVQDAIKTMGQPMIEAAKNFTQATLPELMKTAEWMGQISTNYEKGTASVEKNCKPVKSIVKIPVLPAINSKEQEMNLASNDITTINKNLSKIAQDSGLDKGAVKESFIISFKDWVIKT